MIEIAIAIERSELHLGNAKLGEALACEGFQAVLRAKGKINCAGSA